MTKNLKFILALGDMKIVAVDEKDGRKIFSKAEKASGRDESLRRIAESLCTK
ncbi:hypothetical protein Dip518_000281 [Parelusimicrobium proximum]|uniref:hypothetical protein n=1 Tax=Parelusimicrobium proximum TaxID=3228953 RepID=UPI003D180759